jgi:hypothetical protein
MNPIQYQIPVVPMLGKGMLLLDRLDTSGNLTGAMAVGNVTKFGIEPKDDIAEQYSSMNATSSLIATALKKRQVKINITGTDYKSEVQAVAMMAGGVTQLAVAGATITAEPLASATATKKRRYFQTKNRNIDPATGFATVVLKGGSAGSTVYAIGADFEVADPVQGLIYIPDGSTVDEAHALTLDYHTLVATFDTIAGATVPRVTAKLTFSPDPTDGQKIGIEVWRVNFNPTGSHEFISDDYGNWQLEGLVLNDSVNHPNDPFYLATFYP